MGCAVGSGLGVTIVASGGRADSRSEDFLDLRGRAGVLGWGAGSARSIKGPSLEIGGFFFLMIDLGDVVDAVEVADGDACGGWAMDAFLLCFVSLGGVDCASSATRLGRTCTVDFALLCFFSGSVGRCCASACSLRVGGRTDLVLV